MKDTPDAPPEPPPSAVAAAPLDPENYINRELSQLEFNKRVLHQARDETVPLLERLKLLCISSTNQDEFFEIRVAGLKQRVEVSSAPTGPDNMSPAEVLLCRLMAQN